MTMLKTVYKYAPEDMKNKNIVQLYSFVAQSMGFDPDDKNVYFNCTKINIAKNIQDNIYEAYRLQNPDAFIRQPHGAELQVTVLLAKSGPKVNRDLPDDTIEVFDGFICDLDCRPLQKP